MRINTSFSDHTYKVSSSTRFVRKLWRHYVFR